MNKKSNVILILILILIFIGSSVICYFNNKYVNYSKLELENSLIAKQNDLEGDLIIKGYTIDNPNIILNTYDISPLTALVLFETKKEVEPKVTIVGKDEHSTFTNVFPKTKKHYLSIYGLYAGCENTVLIEYGDVKKTIKIVTDELPKTVVLPTKVNARKDKLGNDLYFFTPASKGHMCAYDVNGDVRWYLNGKFTWDNKRLKNGHMMVSTDRLVNPPYYTSGLYEIDLLGKVYNEYSIPGGYHHDYFELDNGNLLVASNDFNSGKGTVEDVIVEISRETGDIIKKFDLKDILNVEDGKSENSTSYDWFHNNAVWYDEKTNSITLSGRHKDAVINIDYSSGKLNWIIGDSSNWSKEYQKYFFKPVGNKEFEWQWSQHAAMITPEGYVFILDNGNNKSKDPKKYVDASNSYTRGVMYKIDTKKMEIEQIWQYGKERGSEFYSPYISDVDYLKKHHYIVHSGGIVYKNGKVQNKPPRFVRADKVLSDTVELLNDEVIFEIVLPTNNYRVEKLSLYNDTYFKLGKGNRKGSFGRTKIDKKKFGNINNLVVKDKDYNDHNISLTNEVDRLVFKGQFRRKDKVKVKLYKNLVTKEYNVRVSKKPYTAMCVDVFTEEENKDGIIVSKYINKDGLSGNYSIYVEINGKTYNTGKYVNFNE